MPPQDDLATHIDALTVQLQEQNSLWRTLLRGIFYGVGFIIGSTILAVILIGILLPFVRDIPGVQQAFSTGVSLIKTTH